MSLLTFSTIYTSAACLLIAAGIIYATRAALVAAGWAPARVSRAVALVSLLLLGWLGVATVLGWQGAYAAEADRWPTIQYGIFIPIVLGIALYRRSTLLREVVGAVPQGWLIGIQTYRTLGIIFLVLYAGGVIPGFFALPAGIGDIGVGVAALAIGLGYRRGNLPPDGLAILWNIIGIADLVVAVGTGFMSSPSPLQVTAFDLPNQLITETPLILVPTFAVPLSVLLHLASLTKTAGAREGSLHVAAA